MLAAACGGGVEGEYVGKPDETFFSSLTFRSDGKVDVVFVGAHHEVSGLVEEVLSLGSGTYVLLAATGFLMLQWFRSRS
jgi:hypothetical protein